MAQWLERRVLGSNPADGTSLRNFGKSIYATLPVSFGKAVCPFYLESMPVEVNGPTQGVNV